MNTLSQSTVKRFRAMLGMTLMVAASPSAQASILVTDNFDADPGWTGAGNTASGNSYGYSAGTQNALGTAAGEGGGLFEGGPENYYADIVGPSLSLSDALHGDGKFYIDNHGHDLFIQTGHRSSSTVSPSFLGLGIYSANSLPDPLFRYAATIVLNDGTLLRQPPFGTQLAEGAYQFTYDYDPNIGDGQLSLTIVGQPTQVLSLTAAQRAIGATFDAWGIGLDGGSSVGSADFFIDDVTYTIPEPSAVMLLGLGGMILLWRRRNGRS